MKPYPQEISIDTVIDVLRETSLERIFTDVIEYDSTLNDIKKKYFKALSQDFAKASSKDSVIVVFVRAPVLSLSSKP